jgi:hypothetical protein
MSSLLLKCGTSGNAVPTLLMKCGTSGSAVPTLLVSCSTPSINCAELTGKTLTFEFAGIQTCQGDCVENGSTQRLYKMSLSGDPNLTIVTPFPFLNNTLDTGLTLTITRYPFVYPFYPLVCESQEWQVTVPLLFQAACVDGVLTVFLGAIFTGDPPWPDDPTYDTGWTAFFCASTDPNADPVAGTIPNYHETGCLDAQDPNFVGFGGLVRVSY